MQGKSRRNGALKQAIRQSGLKQTYIAAQLDIDVFRFSRIVQGRVQATEIEKAQIAALLRKSVAELFQDDEDA